MPHFKSIGGDSMEVRKNKQEVAADIIRGLVADGKDHSSVELKPKVMVAMQDAGYIPFHVSWYYNGLAILLNSRHVQRSGKIIRATQRLLQ
jgi:hypothetical protein